jgi:hypothetical protein
VEEKRMAFTYLLLKCMETQRWREKLLKSNWSYKNDEMDYKKITKYTKITDMINLEKLLCKIQCKWQKPHKAHSTKGSGRERGTTGYEANSVYDLYVIRTVKLKVYMIFMLFVPYNLKCIWSLCYSYHTT